MRTKAYMSVVGVLMAFLALSFNVQATEDPSEAEWGERMERLSVMVPGEQPPQVDVPVQFAINSAEILPQSRQVLNWIAQAMHSDALKSLSFQVQGHTDASGGLCIEPGFIRAQSSGGACVSGESGRGCGPADCPGIFL